MTGRAKLILCFFLAGSPPLPAQTAPAFEAASVKANTSTDPPGSRFPLGPGDGYSPGRLFSATNQPLIAYLRFAYKLGQSDLPDLPGWVYSDGFDIEAHAAGNPSKDDMRLMMRSLLADRFKLRTHFDPKSQKVFDLVRVGARKPAPGLHPDDASCTAAPPPDLSGIPCGRLGPMGSKELGQARLGGRGVTLAQIAGILKNPFTGVDRLVLDRTGLKGTFDFLVTWQQGPDGSPSFTEALQQQLGLKLVSATGPAEVLVVDHVEKPTTD